MLIRSCPYIFPTKSLSQLIDKVFGSPWGMITAHALKHQSLKETTCFPQSTRIPVGSRGGTTLPNMTLLGIPRLWLIWCCGWQKARTLGRSWHLRWKAIARTRPLFHPGNLPGTWLVDNTEQQGWFGIRRFNAQKSTSYFTKNIVQLDHNFFDSFGDDSMFLLQGSITPMFLLSYLACHRYASLNLKSTCIALFHGNLPVSSMSLPRSWVTTRTKMKWGQCWLSSKAWGSMQQSTNLEFIKRYLRNLFPTNGVCTRFVFWK